MVGKLGTKKPGTKTLGILHRPWGERWQTWKRSARERRWTRTAEPASRANETVALAIPARLVVCAAFWLETEDSEAARGMAFLQAEMRGLATTGQEGVSIDLLDSLAGRTLARVCVFPGDLPVETGWPSAAVCVPSPLAAKFDPDTVHVWKEEGGLVAVVCRGADVVAWETCGAESSGEVAAWLACLLAELDATGLLPNGARILDWTGKLGSVPGFAVLSADEKLQADGPPVPVADPSQQWKPPAALREESTRRRRALVTASLAAAAGLVFAALATALGYSWFLDFQIHRLRTKMAMVEERAKPLRTSAQRWIRVERAVNPDMSPLEILNAAARCLPEGVKLTAFELRDASEQSTEPGANQDDPPRGPARVAIQIAGQARNASLASSLFNALSAAELSRDMNWTMANPTFQPDNTALFVIQGERHGSQPE